MSYRQNLESFRIMELETKATSQDNKLVYFACLMIIVLMLSDVIVNISIQRENWKNFLPYLLSALLGFMIVIIAKKYIPIKIRKHVEEVLRLADLFLFTLYILYLYFSNKCLLAEYTSGQEIVFSTWKQALIHIAVANLFDHWIYQPLGFTISTIFTAVLVAEYYPNDKLVWVLNLITATLVTIAYLCYREYTNRGLAKQSLSKDLKDKQWRTLFDALPSGVLIMNRKGRVEYLNELACSILEAEEHVLRDFRTLPSLKKITIDEFPKVHEDVLPTSSFRCVNSGVLTSMLEPGKFNELLDMIANHWETFSLTSKRSGSESLSGLTPRKENFFCLASLEHGGEKTFYELKFSFRTVEAEEFCIFSFTEITERLSLSHVTEALDYKNRLLASITHELRTPLNGNINFLNSALEDTSVPTKVKNNLLLPALTSAKYLLTIIDDILDLSQIQNGKLKLNLAEKSLVSSIREAMELLKLQAFRKHLNITLELPSQNWDTTILTDHSRLVQILSNLLSNAIKFTFDGTVTIKIEEEHSKIYLISVEDTGVGLKAEDQRKLQKFYKRTDMKMKSNLNPQGIGLGLVISNALAKLIGPNCTPGLCGIFFESEYKKGSKFYFRVQDFAVADYMNQSQEIVDLSQTSELRIPTEVHEMDKMDRTETCQQLTYLFFNHRKSEKRLTVSNKFLATKRVSSRRIIDQPNSNKSKQNTGNMNECKCPQILIVDDDSFNIIALENLLYSFGFSIESCFNGQEAVQAILERISSPCKADCQPYKAIFLDCNMPVMDGYECALKLKEIFAKHPRYKCPIIACTAFVQTSEIQKALDSGMESYVNKPLSKDKIRKLLKDLGIAQE